MKEPTKIEFSPRTVKELADAFARAFNATMQTATLPHGVSVPASELATPLDGWHEVTMYEDEREGRRVFLAGPAGQRRVNATGVELGKARAELMHLKQEIGRLADAVDDKDRPGLAGAIRKLIER